MVDFGKALHRLKETGCYLCETFLDHQLHKQQMEKENKRMALLTKKKKPLAKGGANQGKQGKVKDNSPANEYDNEMRGVLFENDKGDNENRPDFRGSCTILGVEYKISAWNKTAKSGQDYVSLSFQAKDVEL